MTAELLPTNPDLVADDSHWEGSAIPIEDRFRAAMSNIRFHDARAIHVINLVKYLAKVPLYVTPIDEFDTIAQPTEGPAKLIKVVQDTRWLKTPSPLTISTRKQRAEFEERASAMAKADLYLGHKARTWTGHSSWRSAQVTRQVSYFTYQEGDRHLFGVPSDRFADYDKDQLPDDALALLANGAVVRPPLVVGQIYDRGIVHRGLTKVVAADILERKLLPSARRLRRRPRLPRGDQGPHVHHHNQGSSNGAWAAPSRQQKSVDEHATLRMS